MGKSSFPKRYQASLKATAATKKTVDKDSNTFKTLGKALSDGGTIANNMPRDYKAVYNQQADQMVAYGKAVAMIQEYEDELAKAGKDKTKKTELEKKIKAEEKKCETCIKALNDLRAVFAQLRALVQTQMTTAQTEFAKLDSTL